MLASSWGKDGFGGDKTLAVEVVDGKPIPKLIPAGFVTLTDDGTGVIENAIEVSFTVDFSDDFSGSPPLSPFLSSSVTFGTTESVEVEDDKGNKLAVVAVPPNDFKLTSGENVTFLAGFGASIVSLVYSVVVLFSPSPTECNILDNFSLSMLRIAVSSTFDGFSFGFTKLILNSSSSSSSLKFLNFARKLGGGCVASTLNRRSFLTAVGGVVEGLAGSNRVIGLGIDFSSVGLFSTCCDVLNIVGRTKFFLGMSS